MRMIRWSTLFTFSLLALTPATPAADLPSIPVENRAKDIAHLIALVEKGSEDKGQDDYTWFEAADILGDYRALEAIPALVAKLHVPRHVSAAGGRNAGSADFAAAMALAKIGLPVLSPMLDQFLKANPPPGMERDILVALLDQKPALAYLDAYLQEKGAALSDAQKKQLAALRTLVATRSAPQSTILAEVKATNANWLKTNPLVTKRLAIIAEQIKLLEAIDRWSDHPDRARPAIETLTTFRAAEAIPLLIKHLQEEWPLPADPAHPLADHPAATALLAIDTPALAPLLKAASKDDQAIKITADILTQMLPPGCAESTLQKPIAAAPDIATQDRLQKIAELLH